MKKFIPITLVLAAALTLLGCQSAGRQHSMGKMAMMDKKCNCCKMDNATGDSAKGKMGMMMMNDKAGHDYGSSTNAPSATTTNAPPAHVHVH